MNIKRSLALLTLILAGTVSAETLYVDSFSPFCYNQIRDAVNAAQDGDLILVSPGFYSGFNVDKSLTIVGLEAGGDPVRVFNKVTVHDVPEGSSVYLEGMFVTADVLVLDCLGKVTINDLAVDIEILKAPYLEIRNSRDVRLHGTKFECDRTFVEDPLGALVINSRVEFASCELLTAAPAVSTFDVGMRALQINSNSRVHLANCQVSGSTGFAAVTNGAAAVTCLGELIVTGSPDNSLIRGGDTSKIISAGQNILLPSGGPALVLGDSFGTPASATISGTPLEPGTTFNNNAAVKQWQFSGTDGEGPFGAGKPAPAIEQISGRLFESSPIDPTLSMSSGMETQLEIFGTPGGVVSLNLGTTPIRGGSASTLIEPLVQASESFALGVLPASGFLSFDLNNLTAIQQQTTYWLQAEVTYGASDLRFTNSTSIFLDIQEFDCNNNGIEDLCEFDCNENGVPDECDLIQQTSSDSNGNDVPDECEQLVYVWADATGRNDGSSWENAFVELQSAMRLTAAGDTIWIAKGRYFADFDPEFGVRTGERLRSFRLLNGMTLLGGFAGDETDASQRDPETNPTILSGDIGLAGESSDDSYSIIAGFDIGETTLVDGLVLVGGNANGSSVDDANGGAGIRLEDAPIRVNNCTFLQNKGELGGGLYSQGGQPILSNCTFLGCEASLLGGAVYLSFGTARFSNLEIRDCTAPQAAALYIPFTATVFGGLFVNNVSTENGTLLMDGGVLELINCTMLNNTNLLTSREAGNINVRNSIIWGNTGQTFKTNGSSNITLTFSHTHTAAPTMGTGALVQDPLLQIFADGSYEFLPNSPCIDSGKLSFISQDFADLDNDGDTTEETPLDLALQPRRVDSLDVPDTGAGAAPDIDRGCFERATPK